MTPNQEPRLAAEVIDGQVYLTPDQERLTQQESPVALELFDLFAIRNAIRERYNSAVQGHAEDDEIDHITLQDIIVDKANAAADIIALRALEELVAPHLIDVPLKHQND